MYCHKLQECQKYSVVILCLMIILGCEKYLSFQSASRLSVLPAWLSESEVAIVGILKCLTKIRV